MDDKLRVSDLLGISPVARSVERVTDSALSGAEAVLGRVCLPAAEELGLLLRDKVSVWRQDNALSAIAKAKTRLLSAASEGKHAPPRLIMESLKHASWSDNEDVQEMWAGLLASSCSASGTDDSNWIFINLLGQLTALQAVILKTACELAQKAVMPNGLLVAQSLYKTAEELYILTSCRDVQRLDRELDHLRTLGLIAVGFQGGFASEPLADISPTALGLHLYVRSQGSLLSPVVYFGLTPSDVASA